MKASKMAARHLAMLEEALGPVIREALAVPGTVEILVNPDQTIWHEVHGQDRMVCLGTQSPQATAAVIRLVATLNGKTVHADKPSLNGVLPGGQRFQGFLPPRSPAPAFCIRVHQAQVLTREDYVPSAMPATVWDLLVQAIADRLNILIVGGMASGKSTLFNALIQCIPKDIRVCTMEDTAEAMPSVPNYLQLYAGEDGDLQDVVKDGFRTAARRILIGEIRDGKTAMRTLKVWLAVGGGIATTHANSAREGLAYVAQLCRESQPGVHEETIGRVVDLVVFLKEAQGQRQVWEVLRIYGWKEGHYDEEMVFDRRTAVAA
jgi:type IV secretion system protein TrbB